jgi:hypothetical protein
MKSFSFPTGTNIIKEYKKTLSNPDGSEKKGDVIIPTLEEALPYLKDLVEKSKAKTKNPKKAKKWDFATSPHAQFGKTLDDTFMAFLKWARRTKGGSKNDINVSKAFRRLESYAEWMDDTGTDLTVPPLTASSVKRGLEAFKMTAGVDKTGDLGLLWWIDVSKMDRNLIQKELAPEETLRAFVWYSHFLLYNEMAQEKGMTVVQNIDKLGLIASFTLIPAKLSSKLDRLTIGVLPIKMKAAYMLDSPAWMNIFMGLMSMFMSKKLKERIINIKDWGKLQDYVPAELIPKGFGKLEGSFDQDICVKEYFS